MSEMSGPSSLPSTPLPSAMGSNYPFFESTGMTTQEEDNNMWGTGSQQSPGSKRCPTFKDYSEKIKQLQQENFQLRVRVFLSEQKTGVKSSSSDFAVLFQQNMQQLQNALNANNASSTSHSTTSSSSNEMSSQLSYFKSHNEQLNNKVIELEQKIASYQSDLKDKQIENDHLVERNDALIYRLQDLETEFSTTKTKMQQQINQAQLMNASTINDVDVARGALIAFGDDFDHQHKQEMETKLALETDKVHHLEDITNRLSKKLGKSKVAITSLEETVAKLEHDNNNLKEKLMECSKVFVDFGRRNIAQAEEIEILKHAQGEKQMTMDSLIHGRYENARQLVTMLQGRMKEIVAFVDALLKLEAKKIFTIIGLQPDQRDNLCSSLEQCRRLSQNLDELFQSTDNSIMSDGRLRLTGPNASNNDSISYNSHQYGDRREAGDLDSPVQRRKCSVAFKEIQCNLLSDVLFPSHSERSVVQLQRDLIKSESKRRELLAEQANLRSQLEVLQSNLHASYSKIQDLEEINRALASQSASAAVEMENKAFAERLSISDSALRKLHQEHANLVAKLKKMQSQIVPISASQDKLINSYIESERPSDTTSPDLGIDSGQDGAANSDDSHSMNFKLENRELRKTNRELAIKLRQTRQMLSNTLEKLHSTAKQKEEVEKAICRQLHKTHTILRQAKKSVEQFTSNQENLVPS